MADYSWKEMLAILFSREIKDHQRITSGAHTEIFFAATMLAQKTHAPSMKLQLGGFCVLCNVVGQDIDHLPKTSTSYELLRYAEAAYDHPDTFLFFGPPGGKKYYEENSPYQKTNHYWVSDKFFAGGIQVDKYGSSNLIGLGTPGKLTMRGPGTIGLSDIINTVKDVYVFITAHDKRRLVEKVDFVSMPGRRAAREAGFMGGGPKWIVTPKCIFDFDPETDEARLYSLLPGVTIDDVRANTGFHVNVGPHTTEMEPPTMAELEALRTLVDKDGVLRH